MNRELHMALALSAILKCTQQPRNCHESDSERIRRQGIAFLAEQGLSDSLTSKAVRDDDASMGSESGSDIHGSAGR